MADITHDFLVHAEVSDVFDAVSTPEGLDRWWTKTCSGSPAEGAAFTLGFGPDHQWRGVITRYDPPHGITFRIENAVEDWDGSSVGVELEDTGGKTQVRFVHRDWSERSQHYRTSCYCWAMYLRIMKRWIEHGEEVPYEQRLEV